MQPALYPAFIFSVILIVTTAYFLLGGLPLLVLKHDVALDARFIRSFFTVYYRAAFWTSAAAFISFAACGRYGFAAAMVVVAGVAVALRQRIGAAMAQLGARIEAADDLAIGGFRRVHATALGINLVQLVALVWGIIRLAQPAS